MSQRTERAISEHPPGEPPVLLSYVTWYAGDCYHARYKARLPQSALAAGCVEEVTATTGWELAVAATRNRIRITVWRTRRWAELQERRTPRSPS